MYKNQKVPDYFHRASLIGKASVRLAPEFMSVLHEARKDLAGGLDIPVVDAKVRDSILPQLQELAIQKIKLFIKDARAQARLIARIKAIHYESGYCSDDGLGPMAIDAKYNDRSKTIRYCGGNNLLGHSEFKIAEIIAHELSHAIDPCSFGFEQLALLKNAPAGKLAGQYPFAPLVSCLRSETSIGASLFPEARTYKPKTYQNELQVTCKSDQINESFADWFAAELLPSYISSNFPNIGREDFVKAYKNAVRDLCFLDGADTDWEEHPPAKKRINAILAAQPFLRAQMGCGLGLQKYQYCGMNGSEHQADSYAEPLGNSVPAQVQAPREAH